MAFKKIEKRRIGLKVLVSGETGSGKSVFGLTAPKVGITDSEAGTTLYQNQGYVEVAGKKYNDWVLSDDTSDIEELEGNLDAIIDDEIDIETFVIDSETKFYNAMVIGCTEVAERKAKQNGKNLDMRKVWGDVKNINSKMQQAKITLSGKGKHVISVVQGKWVEDEDTKVKTWTLECNKSLPFDYDIVLRFFTETDKKTKETKYFAEVLKDRTNVHKVGDIIENCVFDEWNSVVNGMKNDKVMDTNFSQDLKNSVKSVVTQIEKADQLSTEIKTMLKGMDTDNQKKAKVKIDELGISLKDMSDTDVDVLKELHTYLKSL